MCSMDAQLISYCSSISCRCSRTYLSVVVGISFISIHLCFVQTFKSILVGILSEKYLKAF